MVKHGSVLLVVLMMLSVLGIGSFIVVRTGTFLVDGALARERYEQNYRLTEGLLNYGIACAQYQFDLLKNGKKELKWAVGSWPFENSSYQGLLLFFAAKEGVVVKASLTQNAHILCVISCQLEQKDEGFMISHWKIGAQ